MLTQKQRIELTTSCRDSDYIPKVDNAGSVITSENGDRVQVMHNGCVVLADAYYSSFQTEIIQDLRGHHEPQEEKVFYEVLKHIKSGAVMLELGAYWSYYSLWFQTTIEQSTNYMIEPTQANLEVGMRNFSINNKKGNFIQAFIGKQVDETTHPRTTTVDEIIKLYNIDYLDILHSDIQGHEYDMLIGAQNALMNKKVKFVFISTHGLIVHYQCMNLLKKYGFYILTNHTPPESYSIDGLIVATSVLEHYQKISISKNIVGFKTSMKSLAARLLSFFSS
jgi:hypothetical protein